jgi:molybdenum cofactor cytidylyltransferase
MGRDKLLLPWGRTVVLGAVLETLELGGVERTIVVTSAANVALARWLEGAGQAWALNERPERGMLSSIWAGIEGLGGEGTIAREASVLVVCPGDLPGIRPRTVGGVISEVERGALLAVPTFAGRRGHPLALSAVLAEQIVGLDLGLGLRELVAQLAEEVVELAVDDPGILHDLDTPEDYARAVDL